MLRAVDLTTMASAAMTEWIVTAIYSCNQGDEDDDDRAEYDNHGEYAK